MDNLDQPYSERDLINIVKLQLDAQKSQLSKANRLLLCDTEMLVIKIWYEHFYGSLDPALKEAVEHQHFDLYLLMDIDLPWEYDAQREHPDKREYFFGLFKDELDQRKANYAVINGDSSERLNRALQRIDSYLDQIDQH